MSIPRTVEMAGETARQHSVMRWCTRAGARIIVLYESSSGRATIEFYRQWGTTRDVETFQEIAEGRTKVAGMSWQIEKQKLAGIVLWTRARIGLSGEVAERLAWMLARWMEEKAA